jgi:hypothetical protein
MEHTLVSIALALFIYALGFACGRVKNKQKLEAVETEVDAIEAEVQRGMAAAASDIVRRIRSSMV